jgi:hypothetical protein
MNLLAAGELRAVGFFMSDRCTERRTKVEIYKKKFTRFAYKSTSLFVKKLFLKFT